MQTRPDKTFLPFMLLLLAGLIVSGIQPHDYFTWFLEVFPAVIAMVLIAANRKNFPLSGFLSLLILIHCYVLFIGGHYTYAEVPFFNHIKAWFHQSRNNYDKVGHFLQGFVPAMVTREILIRKRVLAKGGWLFFICLSVCLATSALYELLEALVAVLTGDSAEAFLGTQGYVWDTQSDMSYALAGAVIALSLFAKIHDRSMGIVLKHRNN